MWSRRGTKSKVTAACVWTWATAEYETVSSELDNTEGKQLQEAGGNQDFVQNTLEFWDADRMPASSVE